MPLIGLRILMVAAIALYLVPTGAHLFELPAKMALSASDYMVVQRLYAGWALFGVAILAAILLTSLHALLRRRHRGVRILSLAAILCLIGTQAIFWVFTFPMNVASNNWTVMPEHFDAARSQWEYSHAASAVLTFAALLAATASVAVDVRRADAR